MDFKSSSRKAISVEYTSSSSPILFPSYFSPLRLRVCHSYSLLLLDTTGKGHVTRRQLLRAWHRDEELQHRLARGAHTHQARVCVTDALCGGYVRTLWVKKHYLFFM